MEWRSSNKYSFEWNVLVVILVDGKNIFWLLFWSELEWMSEDEFNKEFQVDNEEDDESVTIEEEE